MSFKSEIFINQSLEYSVFQYAIELFHCLYHLNEKEIFCIK